MKGSFVQSLISSPDSVVGTAWEEIGFLFEWRPCSGGRRSRILSECRRGRCEMVGGLYGLFSGLFFLVLVGPLVPAQRVLCHNRRTDHLGATSTLATGTSSRSRGGTLAHGIASGAGALVKLASLAVTAGDPEHGSTVCGSASHGTSGNTSCAGLALGAGAGTTIGAATSTTVVTVSTATAATRAAVGRAVLAVHQGNGRVDHAHQRGDRLAVRDLVKGRVDVGVQLLDLIETITRVVEDGNRSIVSSLLPVVVRLQSPHGSLGAVLGASKRQSARDEAEDLRRRHGNRCDPRPRQAAVKANLQKHGVGGRLSDIVRRD